MLSTDECKLAEDVASFLENDDSALSTLLAEKVSPEARVKLLTALSDLHLKTEDVSRNFEHLKRYCYARDQSSKGAM